MFTILVLLTGAIFLSYRNILNTTEFPWFDFKNKYFPIESGAFQHAWRNIPYGYVVGNQPGKMSYENPLPFRVVNEFNDKLIDANWGYAAPLNSPAINTKGYKNLLNVIFNKEEHPRLDLTRQDPTKGRHRRHEWYFYPSD